MQFSLAAQLRTYLVIGPPKREENEAILVLEMSRIPWLPFPPIINLFLGISSASSRSDDIITHQNVIRDPAALSFFSLVIIFGVLSHSVTHTETITVRAKKVSLPTTVAKIGTRTGASPLLCMSTYIH